MVVNETIKEMTPSLARRVFMVEKSLDHWVESEVTFVGLSVIKEIFKAVIFICKPIVISFVFSCMLENTSSVLELVCRHIKPKE